MKKLFIIFIFMLLLSSLTGCASCGNGILTGKVTDNSSSAALAGVKVSPVDGNGMPIASDSNGIYRTTRFVCGSKSVDVKTDPYSGYDVYRGTALFTAGSTTTKNISMKKR